MYKFVASTYCWKVVKTHFLAWILVVLLSVVVLGICRLLLILYPDIYKYSRDIEIALNIVIDIVNAMELLPFKLKYQVLLKKYQVLLKKYQVLLKK